MVVALHPYRSLVLRCQARKFTVLRGTDGRLVRGMFQPYTAVDLAGNWGAHTVPSSLGRRQ